VRRGEVWWAELPTPAGRRPVVLLSRDEAYPIRNLVTVAPVTTRIRDIPTEVGRGQMDIRAILAALIEVKYEGVVAFEYERAGVNAALGLAESVGYVRGMLGAMA